MRQDSEGQVAAHMQDTGPFAPLRVTAFRRIWSTSLISNFGHLILGVGAAWQMTKLTDAPEMVALVQTALMVPLMLVALPAGAIADMFDRRKVALTGLAFASLSGATLAVLAVLGLVTPWVLLALLVFIGAGVAFYGPAWQASIGELVDPPQLPSAVALGAVSYNLARSFGPAIGGLLVVAFGAQAAFGMNAVGYLFLIAAFLLWKRDAPSSRLPPESFGRALVSGFRFARHASGVRNVVARAFAFGLAGATGTALAPLIAKDLLQGNAATFGILLGASGVGAVIGSLRTAALRERFGPENTIRLLTVAGGLALAAVGLSHQLWLTCLCFLVVGASNMVVISMLNVGVQLSSPRWVTARALSVFTSALTGGIAIGSWFWGEAVAAYGLSASVVASGLVLSATVLLGFLLPVHRETGSEQVPVAIPNEPNVKLGISMRSGPIAVMIDYRVDPDNARDFYAAMMPVQKVRQRNGGFGWSLARDIADPWMWTERYECPTWGDYLRMRDRYTQAAADSFNSVTGDRVRRRLMRPFGSVRWRADTPDPGQPEMGLYGLMDR